MLLGATGNVGGYILHLLVQRLGMTRVRASSRKMNTLMDARFAFRPDKSQCDVRIAPPSDGRDR
jgi:uncharacterized protein YbjT (DUF2867 family)